jgi:hypothetical protein
MAGLAVGNDGQDVGFHGMSLAVARVASEPPVNPGVPLLKSRLET